MVVYSSGDDVLKTLQCKHVDFLQEIISMSLHCKETLVMSPERKEFIKKEDHFEVNTTV